MIVPSAIHETPLNAEISDRIRMLEAVIETDGELHRAGVIRLLETLRKVARDRDVLTLDGYRDTW